MMLSAIKRELEGLYPALYLELTDSHLPPESHAFELTRIVIRPEARGQGIGSAVMTFLCGYADHHHLTILLNPDASLGATSRERLIEFYGRFGFVANQFVPGGMVRWEK